MVIRCAENDIQTIAGLKRHDPSAMVDLYDRYGRIVYSVVYRIVRNSGEAEEILQEVFLRVWTRAHLVEDSCLTLGPWLLTITRNLALDHLRSAACRNRRFVSAAYEFVSEPAYFEPPEIFLWDHQDRLRRALTDLTADQRAVIQLAYFEGLSQTEISARMGKPLGTVKSWVRAALGVLRENFTGDAGPIAEWRSESPEVGPARIATRR